MTTECTVSPELIMLIIACVLVSFLVAGAIAWWFVRAGEDGE